MSRVQAQQNASRRPDWPAAAVAGFAAGAILMVLDLLWSLVTTGSGPWATSNWIAEAVMGVQTADTSKFDPVVVAVALAAHYALGIVSGIVLAAAIVPLRMDETAGKAIVAGLVFGLAVYLVNFHGFASFLPWFAKMRGWTTFVAHLVFGVAAALLYWKLGRRGEGTATRA